MGKLWTLHVGGNVPWRAGEDVDGDWEKVSKSRRMAEDCLSAELKREFYLRISIVPVRVQPGTQTMLLRVAAATDLVFPGQEE